jgi:F-type H+-transporting ATPase subunit a
MQEDSLMIQPVLELGPVQLTNTVLTTWIVILITGALVWLATRRLQMSPGRVQTLLEAIVISIEEAVRNVAPQYVQQIMPFIGSLWLFLAVANLIGLIPGMHSPTRDLSATAAIAFLVFLSVHWYGIRIEGVKNYLQHYLKPSPIMLPFHLLSEVTRTIALAVRLFGNMMSLEMVALLVLMVAGFLVPIPILMLHIVEAMVQAYIFGMLALIYVAGGLQTQQRREQTTGENHD